MSEYKIYANKYWNETDAMLQAGIQYQIKVVPGEGESLYDAQYKARGIEGEDWDSWAHTIASCLHAKRQNDAKWFALIGTIDKKFSWIIKENEVFAVPVSGRLFCYFNDVRMQWFYGNNSGYLTIDVIKLSG